MLMPSLESAELIETPDGLRVMPTQTEECCGESLHWLIAEASDGFHTRQLWRCARCERFYQTGWVPPTWINATAAVCHQLNKSLDAAVAAEYSPGHDDLTPDKKP